MGVGRPRLGAGEYGVPNVAKLPSGHFRARVQAKRANGSIGQIQATGATKALAITNLHNNLARMATYGPQPTTRQTTFRQVAQQWYGNLEKSDRAESTKTAYLRVLKSGRGYADDGVLLRELGDLPIVDITPGRVFHALMAIAEKNGPAQAKLSKTVAISVFKHAVMLDLVPRNAAREAQFSESSVQQRKGAHEIQALTTEQTRSLVAALRDDQEAGDKDIRDVVFGLIATGARIGEVMALSFDDVQIDAKPFTVRIGATLIVDRAGRTIRQLHPKSSSSIRELVIPDAYADVLRARRARMLIPAVDNVVYPTTTGTLRATNTFRKQWRDIRDRLGFQGVTPHTFRRTVATHVASNYVMARDVDMTAGDLTGTGIHAAQQQLGHARVSETEQRYVRRPERRPDLTPELAQLFEPPQVNVPDEAPVSPTTKPPVYGPVTW